MRTIAEWLFDRWMAGGDPWTICITFHDDVVGEYRVHEILCDGVLVEPVTKSEGKFVVTYAACASIKIMEEGEA